jgi:uncharacterized protein (TIGR02271 family)
MASMVDDQAYRENEPRVLADDERLTIAVHEETLEPRLREVETGRVRVHKRVEEVPDELLVDAGRDEVTIERVPIDQTIESAPEPRQEGDTLVIPVVEEVIVTETRLVLREEVRITRRRVTEQIPVQATLRKERVEIEQLDENAFDQSASR